ncbi:MAG: DUF1501 domain-containing protein [Verrucomicrobia bacterium]|nr:DUF1501 domain-containing protein [Verrucomicrobiota bacterium]
MSTDSIPVLHDLLTRRSMIARLGGGVGMLGLANVMKGSDERAAQRPHRPRAQRVIQLFMNGGPFQADLFDPKPDLQKYAGQRPAEVNLRTERATAGLLPSPVQWLKAGQSGVPISDMLPKFAACMDDVCVIRSLHSDNPNHGPALLMMNNGTITPSVPSMGAWISYGLGTENENLPAYVVLCPGRPVRFSVLWNSAFLPSEHQGVYVNHSNLDVKKLIPFLSNGSMDFPSQQRQLGLMRQFNQLHLNERGGDAVLESRIRSMETAFRMQTEASEAFNLEREPESIREKYGKGHFANGCLLARRLVERGTRFVQVYYGDGQPWDTHQNHDKHAKDLCRDIDQPMTALLTDLKQRGLLDDTLVIWGGEFGRTPTSENGSGRDHNHYGFTTWLAGGGVKGGVTYGETDDFGFRAVKDRVHVNDFHATILHLMGMDHEQLTYRYAGRDFRLTNVGGHVLRRILA